MLRLLLAGFVLSLYTPASGDTIQLTLRGTVRESSGAARFFEQIFGSTPAGTPFEAVLTYDPSAPDSCNETETKGCYQPAGDLTITINSTSLAFRNDTLTIANDDRPLAEAGSGESVQFTSRISPIPEGFERVQATIVFLSPDQRDLIHGVRPLTDLDAQLFRTFPVKFGSLEAIAQGQAVFQNLSLDISSVDVTSVVAPAF